MKFQNFDADREAAIRARLTELRDAQLKPYIDKKTGKQDGYCRKDDNEIPKAEWQAIWKEQKDLRDELKAGLMASFNAVHERKVYAVCGWSEKHEYFRNKRGTFNTLDEAKALLETLKTEEGWGIPTVIVQLVCNLWESPEPENFATDEPRQLSSSHQYVVGKAMCGYKGRSWAYFFNRLHGGYTY